MERLSGKRGEVVHCRMPSVKWWTCCQYWSRTVAMLTSTVRTITGKSHQWRWVKWSVIRNGISTWSHGWLTSHREKTTSTDWRSWRHSPSWSISLPDEGHHRGASGLWVWGWRRQVPSTGYGHIHSPDRILKGHHTKPTSGRFYVRAWPACFKKSTSWKMKDGWGTAPRFEDGRDLTTT